MLINEKTIERLANLARIKVNESQKEKIAQDLGGILSYFEELTKLNTEEVEPINGGTELVNVFRKDEENQELSGKGKASFPEEEKGFLKVPSVFER